MALDLVVVAALDLVVVAALDLVVVAALDLVVMARTKLDRFSSSSSSPPLQVTNLFM